VSHGSVTRGCAYPPPWLGMSQGDGLYRVFIHNMNTLVVGTLPCQADQSWAQRPETR
jgi:hypothetical protein